MRLALSTSTCPDSMVDEPIRLARQVGADGIEVCAREPQYAESYDPPRVAAVRRVAESQGVAIASLRTSFRVGAAVSGARRSAAIEELIRQAAQLGAPAVSVLAGDVSSTRASSEDFRRAARELAVLCERGAESYVRMAIEMHENTLADTGAGAAALAGDLGIPGLAVVYSPSAELSSEDPVERLKLVAPLAYAVHARNWDVEPGGVVSCAPLASGLVDYAAILEVLRASGFGGWLVLTDIPGPLADRPQRVREDMDYLRSLVALR